MSEARERSPRHQRPWSVYRANTFDLSSEMIGLALAGENGKGLCVGHRLYQGDKPYERPCDEQLVMELLPALYTSC